MQTIVYQCDTAMPAQKLPNCCIQTTEIYARADSKQKREALESAYVNMIPNDITERSWEKDQELKIWLRNLSK